MAPAVYGTTAPSVAEVLHPDEVQRTRRRRQPWITIAAGTVVGIAGLLVVANVWLSSDGSDANSAIGASSGNNPPPAATAEASPLTTTSKPHILLVTLDDVGWNDMGAQSSDMSLLTPHMSALSTDGVTLTSYYGQALCTPARASLHSGKFVHRIGFTSKAMEREISAVSNYSVPLANRLLAQRLKTDGGYATVFVGKWNIGHCADEYAPWNRGFDSFLGYFSSGVNYARFVRFPQCLAVLYEQHGLIIPPSRSSCLTAVMFRTRAACMCTTARSSCCKI
jgi:hypothetical protein